LDLRDLKASLGRWQTGLADRGWNSLYLNNHDQPRAVTRYGDSERWWRESATALATVLHLHRGTPFVYQGEEIGMTNAPFSNVEAMRDVESIRYYRTALALGLDADSVWRGLQAMGRDNARTPMQWDGTEHAGFTTGDPCWRSIRTTGGSTLRGSTTTRRRCSTITGG
jgi:oligo-1,6-glucosidase